MYSENGLARAGGGARATIRQMILSGQLAAIVVREDGRRRFLIPAAAALELIARRAQQRSVV
jgi:hypothetical protein